MKGLSPAFGLAPVLVLITASATHAAKKVFTVPFKARALDFTYGKDKDAKTGNCGEGIVDAVYINDNPTCSAECAIAYTTRGEWVEYIFESNNDVHVNVEVLLSSTSRGRKILLKLNGSDLGVLKGPGQGLETFKKRKTQTPVFVQAGVKHKLLVKFLDDDVRLCSIDVSLARRVFEVPFVAERNDFSYRNGTKDAGEWVAYRFKSSVDQTIDISARLSSDNYPPPRLPIRVKLDGKNVGAFEGPDGDPWEYQKQTISGIAVKGGKWHTLKLKFITGGVNVASVSVFPKRSQDELTLFAKYDWQNGAKDVSNSFLKHDGVLDSDDVTAKDGTLTVVGCKGVDLGYMEELDEASLFLLRFEDVIIQSEGEYSVFAGGGEDWWWVGLDGRKLAFSVGGFGGPELLVEVEGLKSGASERVQYSFDSIEYRFNGTAVPRKRLAIRYNDGEWVEGGWKQPDLMRTLSSRETVRINDSCRADWDVFNGSVGTVYFYANL